MTFPPNLLRSNRKRPRLLAMLFVAILFTASCSSSDADVAVDSADDSAAPSGDVLAAEVFDGEAVTVDGEVFDLAELADSDLVLWFWAPW